MTAIAVDVAVVAFWPSLHAFVQALYEPLSARKIVHVLTIGTIDNTTSKSVGRRDGFQYSLSGECSKVLLEPAGAGCESTQLIGGGGGARRQSRVPLEQLLLLE